MIRLTLICLAILLASESIADARNPFRRTRTEKRAHSLPLEVVTAQPAPYQAAQKNYQATQKGTYEKGSVATCVRYIQHRPHKKLCRNCGSYNTRIAVYDPFSCSTVDVTICIPGCCLGGPVASCRPGLLGRGITTYSWCCGFTVRTAVTMHGDVTVHYYGS